MIEAWQLHVTIAFRNVMELSQLCVTGELSCFSFGDEGHAASTYPETFPPFYYFTCFRIKLCYFNQISVPKVISSD